MSTSAWPIDQTDAVFEAFSAITDAPTFDPYTSLVTGLLFDATSKEWSISSSAVYTKAVADPPVFRDLLAIPSISNSSSFKRLSVLANETNTPPLYARSYHLG